MDYRFRQNPTVPSLWQLWLQSSRKDRKEKTRKDTKVKRKRKVTQSWAGYWWLKQTVRTQTQGCTLYSRYEGLLLRLFVILSGGLGNGEWVILIKAFCLLPLVYWDATKQRKPDITCRNVSCCLLRHFIPNIIPFTTGEWSDPNWDRCVTAG